MGSQTVRIDRTSHKVLQQLAEISGETMQIILAKAIEEYRRKVFLDQINSDFARLRKNPKAWKQELEERAAWDMTLSDGQDR